MDSVIRVQGLVKKYGDFNAVDEIDFDVREREIFGFLGPNGAGKTTTINILATLLKPTRGRAELAGYDVLRQPNEVRQSIGIVFQDPSLDDRLTADENLRFHGLLYNVPNRVLRERMDQVLQIVGLRRPVWDEHEAILQAVSSGEADRAEQLARAHCEDAGRHITAQLARHVRTRPIRRAAQAELP